MMGRLFLHIGPAKTATTSLQVALEMLSEPRFSYVGVFQPRPRNHESLARHLHEGLENDDHDLLRSCRESLETLVTAGQIVLLSEEMLSLENNALTTSTKIERLGKLFSGMPVTVLITLRDPEQGIFSLYQELYQGLPLSQRLSFSLFCGSSQTDCFDYHLLKTKLEQNGLRDVRWLDFQLFVTGALTTANIFGPQDLWSSQLLNVEKLNAGQKSSDGQARGLGAKTWRETVSARLARDFMDIFGMRGTKFTKKIANALDFIPVRKNRYRNLIVPNARAKQLRIGYESFIGYASEGPMHEADEKQS